MAAGVCLFYAIHHGKDDGSWRVFLHDAKSIISLRGRLRAGGNCVWCECECDGFVCVAVAVAALGLGSVVRIVLEFGASRHEFSCLWTVVCVMCCCCIGLCDAWCRCAAASCGCGVRLCVAPFLSH